MLYNINNNNYISVLDIQLWMMHCLLIYYRDHYAPLKTGLTVILNMNVHVHCISHVFIYYYFQCVDLLIQVTAWAGLTV
jgi:hypothetical protein